MEVVGKQVLDQLRQERWICARLLGDVEGSELV